MGTTKNRRKRYQYKGKRISKGEKKVAQFLDSYNINYIREYSFTNCLSELGNPLRFDFYLPKFNLLLEVDGKHHFEPINKYPKAKKTHLLTVVRDQIKNEYAKINNIKLYRISYKVFNIIEQLLRIILMEYGIEKNEHEPWNQMGHSTILINKIFKRIKRFDNDEECWLWLGSINYKGDASIKLDNGKTQSIYKFIYECYNGPIIESGIVRHSCDTVGCVNPKHLYMKYDIKQQIKRFWTKVDVPNDWEEHPEKCWEWTDYIRPKMAGNFTVCDVLIVHYRFAYELYYGPIPPGMLVCHKCDNPACCNPNHLFLGSHQDNADDMKNKNRQPIGEDKTTHKLSEQDVKQIKILLQDPTNTYTSIALQFNVSSTTISDIKNKKVWTHIT